MIAVILSHPNGQRQDVLLADVPRVGDHIRLTRSDVSGPSLLVERVLWMEVDATTEHAIIIAVRSYEGLEEVPQ